MERIVTDWNKYRCDPDSFLIRHLFLDTIARAYLRLLKKIDFNKPIDVLEFGCGTGYINKCISRIFKIRKMTLIDSNEQMLKIAKDTLKDVPCEKEFVNVDFFDFKVEREYDLVHSQGVIEHFEPDLRKNLLSKHFHSTKKEGYCIIFFPVPSITYFLVRKFFEIIKRWKFPDEVPLDKQLVINEIESLGFKTLASTVFWPYLLTEYGYLFKKI